MERLREVSEGAPTGSFGASLRERRCSWVVLALLLVTLIGPAVVEAADGAERQLEFGAEMARRGLWKEALFRFQQADRLDPDNVRILNNIAVSYEALGLFERALETYQNALRLSQQDPRLRENYSRFLEFYQNFRPREETEAVAEEDDDATGSSTTEGVNG